MKWKSRVVRPGDERVVAFFAWLPVTIMGDEMVETRWLQTVKIRQEYIHHCWADVAFVD